jgi:hypothetical protein
VLPSLDPCQFFCLSRLPNTRCRVTFLDGLAVRAEVALTAALRRGWSTVPASTPRPRLLNGLADGVVLPREVSSFARPASHTPISRTIVSVRVEVAIAAALRRGRSWLPAIRSRSSLVEDEASCDGEVSSSRGRRRRFVWNREGVWSGRKP